LESRKTAKTANWLLHIFLRTKAKSKKTNDAVADTSCVVEGHKVQTVKLSLYKYKS